ncbi:MAG: lysophospholipid acyltransferase family protein [Labilithrix sp.]|nr:lysophospholipid acyltransferase family protein [Labilithrix sp.]
MTAHVVHDLREGGRWSLGQRVKNDAIFVLASLALSTVGRLSPRALRVAGRAIGAIAHAILPRTRRRAHENVARAFPDLDAAARRALVRRAYRTLGENLGEAIAMLDRRRAVAPLPFGPGAREALDEALARGRGVLFASAHLGPWERVAATLVMAGLPFAAVTREAYDPRLTRLVYGRLRADRGLTTIARGAPGAAAALLRTLRRGHILGVPMDLASRVPSVEAPFLGHPAPTPVGPARLALRTGAAVVVGLPAKGDGDALVLAVTPIETADLDATPDGERVLSTRINDVLSAHIRALPEAWVWMHPRWPASERVKTTL